MRTRCEASAPDQCDVRESGTATRGSCDAENNRVLLIRSSGFSEPDVLNGAQPPWLEAHPVMRPLLRNQIANERFLLFQLCHRRIDLGAAEIIYRKTLHDFPFSTANTD